MPSDRSADHPELVRNTTSSDEGPHRVLAGRPFRAGHFSTMLPVHTPTHSRPILKTFPAITPRSFEDQPAGVAGQDSWAVAFRIDRTITIGRATRRARRPGPAAARRLPWAPPVPFLNGLGSDRSAARNQYLFASVGGRQIGVAQRPTVGEVGSQPTTRQPLINAMCVGILRRSSSKPRRRRGQLLLAVGSRTGRDGIRSMFAKNHTRRRPQVRVESFTEARRGRCRTHV
jgi:hypothetical protein